LQGVAVGDISYYVLKPWITRDELFHRTIAEFVQEWSRSEPVNLREVVVIAAQHTGRAYAVSDLLNRNRIPHAFRSRDSTLGHLALAEKSARLSSSATPAAGTAINADAPPERRTTRVSSA